MSAIQLLKKAYQFFRGSNKGKKKKDVIKGCTPQVNGLPSSSQSEEKGDDVDDEKDPNDLKNAKKLFVGCLAPSTTSKELEDYFSRFGTVINCVVIRYPKSRKSRGFGFVTFAYPENAKAALEIKDHVLDRKLINLRPSCSKSKERNYEKRIFLGTLPFDFTEKDVKQFFEKFGKVEDVTIPLEWKTMKSKGFGFLTFKDKFVAEKCIAKGFIYMNGRRVLIKKAEPPNFYEINDNLSVVSSSDVNVEENLEITEDFADDVQFPSISDDNTSSVVSGMREELA